ncbi:hypothetical protein MTO96_039850 [Rhipicephalus appendiculatus]
MRTRLGARTVKLMATFAKRAGRSANAVGFKGRVLGRRTGSAKIRGPGKRTRRSSRSSIPELRGLRISLPPTTQPRSTLNTPGDWTAITCGVAIKTIKKSKIETEQDSLRIRREIQIMSSIQHPYIIHIYEVFENKDKIVLVMQYASGGELYDYVSERKELTSEEARRIFRQVASAVYYCHKNKICHRDLKLENILLDEKGNAKIADFGLSNVYDERHFLSTFCGSPLYASPEIVKGTPYYGPEVDCWSLGVLLYTLVYGAMPFDGSNFKRLVRQISEADYYEPKRKSDASGLIRRLLTVDPAKRATVIDICQDRWVNQGFDHSLLQLAEDMSNLTPVRLDLLLALAPASPTPEEAFDKAANPPDGAEKSDSFDFQPAEQLKNDDSADFIPAALAAELESQNIKRQCSTDGSLMRMSSVSHKNKKVRTSDSSSRKSSVGNAGRTVRARRRVRGRTAAAAEGARRGGRRIREKGGRRDGDAC